MTTNGQRSISVERQFPAGHRILGLEGQGTKCRNIHGHNWVAKWTFEVDKKFPPTVEFGDAKALIDMAIIQRVDHGFFVHKQDDFKHYLETNQCKCIVLDEPPTTEAIAEWLAMETIAYFTGEKRSMYSGDDDFYLKMSPAADALVRVDVQEGPNNAGAWERVKSVVKAPNPYPMTINNQISSGLSSGTTA